MKIRPELSGEVRQFLLWLTEEERATFVWRLVLRTIELASNGGGRYVRTHRRIGLEIPSTHPKFLEWDHLPYRTRLVLSNIAAMELKREHETIRSRALARLPVSEPLPAGNGGDAKREPVRIAP